MKFYLLGLILLTQASVFANRHREAEIPTLYDVNRERVKKKRQKKEQQYYHYYQLQEPCLEDDEEIPSNEDW